MTGREREREGVSVIEGKKERCQRNMGKERGREEERERETRLVRECLYTIN